MYLETDPRWSAPDGMASEFELGDFMYGLVRLLKPNLVIETGCYNGDTSRRIGEALLENGDGRLVSCDTSIERVVSAQSICVGLPVTILNTHGLDIITKHPCDLAFIDSGNDATRVEECKALKMSPGGIIVLHDARRSAYDDLCAIGWKSWFIPTPRGVAVFFA